MDFGADSHVEGVGNPEKVKEIRRRAIKAGLKLVDCPIRHLGTEKAQKLYQDIQEYLLSCGAEILFGYECDNIILDGAVCKGAYVANAVNSSDVIQIDAGTTIIATGRRGADWLEKLC